METSESPVIVLVDDEDMVVTSIKSFLTLETDYEVVGFTTPAEALSYIESHRVDVVVSDYLMPDMDGISLLAKVKDIQPEATRILLTGYADKENAIKAINDVQLFQYVEKPWDNDQLQNVVRAGLERQYLMRTLHDFIDELESTRNDLQGLRKALMRTFA